MELEKTEKSKFDNFHVNIREKSLRFSTRSRKIVIPFVLL